MKITIVVLSAMLCLPLWAQEHKSDEAIEAAAEQLINESAVEAKTEQVAEPTTAEKPAANVAEMKETEIPVFVKPKAQEKSAEGGMIWRLVASFGLLLIVAGALVFASRKWGRTKDKGGQKARIEMMHQFHLGPKKSIALIRVSGEALLVGVTDQNINMLKTVTLIDEELEQALGKDFNNFLEDEFSVEDVRSAIRARA